MKKTAIIFSNTLRRSKMVLPLSLLCGIFMCLGFKILTGMGGGGEEERPGIPVGLLAHEQTAVTDDFRKYLSGELGMEVLESTDIERLNTEMVERKISAVIEVPQGYEAALLSGEPAALEVSFLNDYANAAFVRGYLENYAAGLHSLARAADGDKMALASLLEKMAAAMPPVTAQTSASESLAEGEQQTAFRLIMGFYMMVCFFLAFVMAMQLYDDRKNGSYNRIRTSNVHTAQYLCGVCGTGMVNGLLIIAPFFIFMAVTQSGAVIPVWQAMVLSLLYNLFVIAVAMAAALHLNSKNAILSIIIGTSTLINMIGGAFIPIETVPGFLQQAARATPAFWFINAVENLQADINASWWLNAVVITLFALVFYILSGIKYAQTGRKKRL